MSNDTLANLENLAMHFNAYMERLVLRGVVAGERMLAAMTPAEVETLSRLGAASAGLHAGASPAHPNPAIARAEIYAGLHERTGYPDAVYHMAANFHTDRVRNGDYASESAPEAKQRTLQQNGAPTFAKLFRPDFAVR